MSRDIRRLARGEVQLAVSDSGDGDPPIVLIHGYCCDRAYLAPQEEHLRRRHRVVSIDLRGHGRSDVPEPPYTIGIFADDVGFACEQLGLRRPVLVGHSMGGAVAVALAARQPELPGAVALLDPAMLTPPEVVAGTLAFVETLRGPGYRAAYRGWAGRLLFGPHDDRERRAAIVEAMSATPQRVIVSALEHLARFDGAAALAGVTVPLLCVGCDNGLIQLDRFAALRPDALLGRVVGAGHFLPLEVPAQVNSMLDRFLQRVLAGA